MKKKIIFGLVFLVLVIGVSAGVAIQEANEVKLEKERYDYLEANNLLEIKLTPCISYTYYECVKKDGKKCLEFELREMCRVEDIESSFGDIISIDINIQGKTEAEINEEIEGYLMDELNQYVDKKLEEQNVESEHQPLTDERIINVGSIDSK